ncbi:MAG: hypothetical protein ABSB76_04360 [Streptosporangiaceae bacterium]
MLSEELRQRIQAAVKAERAQAVASDRPTTTKPPERATSPSPANGHAAAPSVSGTPGQRKHAAKPERAVGTKVEPARGGPARHKPSAPTHGRTSAQAPAARPEPPETNPAKEPHGRRFTRSRLVVIGLVLVALGSLITVVSLHVVNSGGNNSVAETAALQRQAALTRKLAASWVAQQVDRDDIVACDHTMCDALRTAGFPAGKLLELSATSQPPVNSSVVVVTEAVRDLFGSSINSAWAPAVLASMGSGAAEVTIRMVAPHGALTFRDQLSSGLASRQQLGRSLQGISQLTFSTRAGQQLTGGQVDSRLMLALAYLAADEPIYVEQFGNVGPGADTYLPLRYADLAVTDQAANMASSAYQHALHAILSMANIQIRPATSQAVTLPGDQQVFRVEFTAPSPLTPDKIQGPP